MTGIRIGSKLVAIAMIGTVCFYVYRTALERYHARRLEALGATVVYGGRGGCIVKLSAKSDANEFLRRAAPGLQVLAESIKNVHLRDRIELHLDGTNVCDNNLRYIQEVRWRVHISVRNTAISDSGLRILSETKEVTGVSADKSMVSEAALDEFYRSRGYGRGPDGQFQRIKPPE
jgi:hypothetical protein